MLCAGVMLLWLLASACGSGNGNGDTQGGEDTPHGGNAATPMGMGTGRYVELNITPPIHGRLMHIVAPDGTLLAFDEGLRNRYGSTDRGITWVQSPGPGAGTERFMDVQSVGLLPGGNLLVYLREEGMATVAPDGTTAHFPVPEIDAGIADGDEFILSFIQVLDDERVLLTYRVDWFARFMRENDGEFVQITGENETRTTQVRVGGTVTGGAGGMVFGMGDVTAIHDIATGQELTRLSHTDAITPMGANANGDVYTLMAHNLVRFGVEGEVYTLLNGTAFAFGAPLGNTVAVSSLPGGGFVAHVMKADVDEMALVSRLFKYIWDENATVDPDKILTIWSLEDNAVVRAAITEIWRLHPEADITLEIALSGDAGISATDAIRTLNTRLLSGRGPDIIILDGTPMESYAQRGMLLNLSPGVDTTGMYQNLLATYAAQGMYIVPTQFTIPMIVGTEAHLRYAATFHALVDAIVNGNPMPVMEAFTATAGGAFTLGGTPEAQRAMLGFTDLDELFHILWLANASAFIYDNRLDSAVLGEFFAALHAISDKYGLGQSAGDMMHSGGVFMATAGGGGGGVNRVSMVGGSLMQYMLQNTHLAAFEAGNIMLLRPFMQRDDSQLALFPGLVPGAWVPSTLVGVSADTRVADFAMAFVNAMLSMEVQRVNHGEGFPIIREAVAWQLEQINEQLAEMDGDLPPFELDLDAFIAQLQTPSLIEATLREMVWQSAERLAQGRLSVEGAVAEVEQNIRNYLAERS